MKKSNIYAMSDIHGCYSKFLQMLEKINFSDEDELYILGDAIDRGSEPLNVLKYIMERKNNIHLLMGNHECFAKDTLEKVNSPIDEISEEFYESDVKMKYFLWTMINGGDTTFDQFYKLSIKEQKEIVSFLQGLPYYKEISVNGKIFFLAHAGLEKYTSDEELEQMAADNFIWRSPGNFDTPLFKEENKFLIFGHTPTFRIQNGIAGRIFKKNNYIGIDCGAVFGHLGGKLGCICLNTMEEFYV